MPEEEVHRVSMMKPLIVRADHRVKSRSWNSLKHSDSEIAELTMCPFFWQITPTSEHIKVDVQGTFVTYLDVEWPGFSVRNISSGQEMQFDTSFKINPLKARKIKGMLTTVFFVYLIIEHQSFYRSLDFSDLSDNGQDS